MPEPKVKPYGSWISPITADLIAAKSIGLTELKLTENSLYWIEMRPGEGGRNVVVRSMLDGSLTDLIPPKFNARTRVHEYGGGSFVVDQDFINFSNFSDQRIYRTSLESEPEPLTPEGAFRFADGVIDPLRGRMICVMEDHSKSGQEAVNTLVSVPLDGSDDIQTLVSGNDFYSSPRISPDGTKLAWLSWNHPNMPWDGTDLWLAEINPEGGLGPAKHISGGWEISIFQPEWSPEGRLHFVSDQTGWWNLYRLNSCEVEPLYEKESEFGRPHWVFGLSTYAFEADDRIICTYTVDGFWHLARLHLSFGELEPIDTPYTSISYLQAKDDRVAFIGGSPTEPSSIILMDLHTGKHEVLRRSPELNIDPGYLSVPEPIEFPTENDRAAYAFYYPPRNADYEGPGDEKPPLIVESHGGPTSATSSTLNLEIQFWTSRGFAFLDVNYSGSSGYGRDYRERLKNKWGILDVSDCENGARFLVDRGDADSERLVIRGGSAGGYTTLCSLVFKDFFKTGASYFGVSDLEQLAKFTHKFESRYLDSMIGPYPQEIELYRARSPIYFIDRLSNPVIFFQGLDDQIVPPDQAERMVAALRKKGLPVAYLAYEGETHGFRQRENIKNSLEAELYFYARILGFEAADKIEPVKIENL